MTRIGLDLTLGCFSVHDCNFSTLKDAEAAGSEMHMFINSLVHARLFDLVSRWKIILTYLDVWDGQELKSTYIFGLY